MIYLGEQNDALDNYSRIMICFLGLKIKGRQTGDNRNGFHCGNSSCTSCNGNGKRRRGLDQEYRNLFSVNIIKNLIMSKPKDLKQMFEDLSLAYTSLEGKTAAKFKKYSKNLFVESGYKDWFLKEKYNYWLSTLLDQHTCTYCNREYIFTYKNVNGGKGMVPQFDHWYSKGDFPLLALSFYNLIPSCATCNTIKSETEFNTNDHLHPYIDSGISRTYRFSYLSLSISKNKLLIKNNSLLNSKGIDTVNALNLPLIFKGHENKELQDLIDLRYKYSENYLNQLLENTFGGLQISKEERYRLIFGIELSEDVMHKRPFSKFKKDIIEELLRIK